MSVHLILPATNVAILALPLRKPKHQEFNLNRGTSIQIQTVAFNDYHSLINSKIRISFAMVLLGFPGGSVVKNPAVNAGDAVSVPGPGRSPGEGNDRGAWWATVHGVAKSQTQVSE